MIKVESIDIAKRSWKRKGYGCGFGIEVFLYF